MNRTEGTERKGLRRFGTLLILIGLLLMAGGLALILYNMWDNNRAGKASDEILGVIDAELEKLPVENAPVPSSGKNKDVDERVDGNRKSWLSDQVMPTLQVDGYYYIGTLEIPDLGLRLPVMDTWDYNRLRISPCLYSGSYYTDDMVICGHNYLRHFYPIKGLAIGADVYFITVDKVIYHYTVCNRETVQPTSIDQMIRNMNNGDPDFEELEDWDLTLFTCNTGGQTRCAVRCIRAE